MNIGVAQLKPSTGLITENIKRHLSLIDLAKANLADAIFFSELSISSYEPKLVHDLAMELEDPRLDVFQKVAEEHTMLIGIGAPLRTKTGIQIAMLIFQAGEARRVYAKQRLHPDENPYFIEGEEQVYLDLLGERIAPAICYESLLPRHSENAFKHKSSIYMASVAKSQKGIDKAKRYYELLAKQYAMPVLLSNCIGSCDNFEAAGATAVWDRTGRLLSQIAKEEEGVILYDTQTRKAKKYIL